MPTVAIQLDPSRLTNPDLDIRYVLPDQLEEDSASAVSDDCYDYGRTSDRLTLFLRTADLAAAVPIVLGTLENEILGNHLLNEGVVVAIAAADRCTTEQEYTVVFPTGSPPFSLE